MECHNRVRNQNRVRKVSKIKIEDGVVLHTHEVKSSYQGLIMLMYGLGYE